MRELLARRDPARLGAGVGGGWRMKASWLASRGVLAFRLALFRCFKNFELRCYVKNFGL
jgi:hypothetical protein